MKPLIDGDIIRYELGFACETGWKAILKGDSEEDPPPEDCIPPWDYVEQNLHQRIDAICAAVDATEAPSIFLTEGPTFREQIATIKPYKGTRKSTKPWHYNNLSVYLKDVMNAVVVRKIEADDAMTIEHVANPDTIVCSRDKDLRQVPGWLYSWELGHQPSFGPVNIDKQGWIDINEKKTIKGIGLSFFYSQCITGDSVDNIPGLEKAGPVAAMSILADKDNMLSNLIDAYKEKYGDDWEARLTEQGQLLWMTRRLNGNGEPVLWKIGMED